MRGENHVPVPLYYQIREDLRELVVSGQLRPGDQLGSERELSGQYGVSIITVKRAVLDLVQEGLLYRVPGKGTFVSQPKMERDLSQLASFTEEMLHHGLKPNSTVLEARIVPADPTVAKRLDVSTGQELISLERVRFANGEPLMLEKTFLPHALFPRLLSQDLTSQSLYHIITGEYGVSLVKARETLEPVIINHKEAENLSVEEGSPGLLLELTAYTDGGKPVEYTKAIVRGDRCKFFIEMAGFRRETAGSSP